MLSGGGGGDEELWHASNYVNKKKKVEFNWSYI